MTAQQPKTRIQQKNRSAILDAALKVFSRNGFRGSTLDQIAAACAMTKTNVLYYYSSKEDIHRALLQGLLDMWLAPLRQIDAAGDPVEQILTYVRRKLAMSRDYPRESKLFANEIVHGAPRVGDFLGGELKVLVDEKAAIIRGWAAAGQIAPVDPYHLIFSIWATTQHYADFDVQVSAVLPTGVDIFSSAQEHLERLFGRLLRPG